MPTLELTRPILFLDVESTGLNFSTDRVISIATQVLTPNLELLSAKYQLVNPGMPIPPESTAIHGITDQMVEHAPHFNDLAVQLLGEMCDRDIGGYGVSFDLQLLDEEFGRCDLELDLTNKVIVDPGVIFKKKEERTLKAAVQFYTGKEMSDAHNALADVRETINVFAAQSKYYQDFPTTREGIGELSRYEGQVDLAGKFKLDKDGKVVFNFGNSKGQPVSQNAGLLGWILDKDFSSDTKRHAQVFLEQIGHAYTYPPKTPKVDNQKSLF